MANRRKNQSCRPSPVVWEKHRSKWSQRLGSRFFGPIFEHALSKLFMNKLLVPKNFKKITNDKDLEQEVVSICAELKDLGKLSIYFEFLNLFIF